MTDSSQDRKASARAAGWTAFAVLAAVVGVVYGQGVHAPFVHDDNTSVLGNPSIVHLWPLFGTAGHPGPLNPPRDAVTSGRPLVNFSFALNHYFGDYHTRGFHVVNMIIHILSSVLLYGLVRRTLLLDRFRDRFGAAAAPLALAVALLWAIHPLQTDSVEYVSQRTESLMGLFYLATFYASLRYLTSETQQARVLAAVGATLACLAGMACKEVMVSAPLMILLFDRTFVARNFGIAIQKSWPLYAGLASGWLFLLALNIDAPRSHAAGLGAGLPAYVWWFTQAKVVVLYLKLSIWPWPLVIHHDMTPLWTLSSSLPWLVPVLLAGFLSLILVWRQNPIGYLGVWFFVILSPTLVVPMPSEVMAERRMYLSLAAIVILVVVGGFAMLTRSGLQVASDATILRASALRKILFGCGVVTITFCIVSSYRLAAYREAVTIWRDAVAHEPDNMRATINLGCALADAGQPQEAIEQFEHALEIGPTHPDAGLAHRSLGLTLARLEQPARAIQHLKLAMQLRPDVANDHAALGSLLLGARRFPEAVDQLELAVRQQPGDILGRANLAAAYANLGRWSEAVAAAEEARAMANAQGATSWAV
jgi:protein O-mannosyl-transferase